MSTDPFVAQLASLCRSGATVAKWVVVRRHAAGRALGERLALEGVDWVNLRFATPFGLALQAAAPCLLQQGLDPLPDGLGPSLVMRLLMERPGDAPSYFRPLADQPRMGDALWAAVSELRLAGISPATLPRAAFEDERKHAELCALLASYEQHLASCRQADAADVYRAAAAHAHQSPIAPGDVVLEAAELAAVPPLVRAFLNALPGRRVACAVPLVRGLETPRRLKALAGEAEASPHASGFTPHASPHASGFHPEASPRPSPSTLAFLLAPGEAPRPSNPAKAGARVPSRLELFHAAGREAEVEAVLRRILAASAIPLDHVEVACAAPDAAALFWEKAQRLELPITVEDGIPATATRPARALLGLCAWIDSNFTANRLRRLLQSGDIRVEFPDGGGGGGRAARMVSKSAATWGRDTYEQSLAALAGRDRSSAEEDEERDEEERKALRVNAEHADFLRGWIRDLLALVPLPDEDGRVALSHVCSGLSALLETRVAPAGALDAAALAAIRGALAGLLELGAFRCPMRQALAFVRDAVERLAVGASRARPGHLHVSSVASAGYAGRPVTFIVGLEEGAVFPSLLEDPVLLDAERAQISGSLATSHDRLAESVHAVMSRLAVLGTGTGLKARPYGGSDAPPDNGSDPPDNGSDAPPDNGSDAPNNPHDDSRASGPGDPPYQPRVCLSYSCRDLRDGRETAPSWLMLQAMRVQKGKPDLTYEELREELGTPETLVAPRREQALTDAAWWLTSLKAAGEQGTDAVLDAFPSLAAGRAAEEARDSDAFTEWDGFVPAARALLDPRVSGKAASVTRLERLVLCPFRYFLEHGLGLEVVDDDPDRDEWLDPMQKGSVLHEIFATLCREARAKKRRLSPRKDGFRARQLADETLAALRAQCPPPSEVVFDRERADLLRDVELFVEFESNRPDSEPVAFEVAFGHEDGGGEPLAQAAPIEISLGKGERFLLRGTIDRIDRLPDGSYEVIDYKTGKYDRAKYQGVFGGGAVLQHALYAIAAATLLRRVEPKPRVVRGVYEFPSAKGGGERVPMKRPDHGALVAVLTDLFDVMAAGAFVPADQKKECEWCDFSCACGIPVGQARAKLENAGNAALKPYLRLRNHE